MNRKTLAVCEECHDKIHAGKYDGKKIRCYIVTGERRKKSVPGTMGMLLFFM
nr:hypothetical protein [Bacillus cereus]